MYVTPEQLVASNKANVEAMVGLAQSGFATLEKLSTLNLNASKAAFEDFLSTTRSLAGAKDAQELASLSITSAQPAMEKAVAYSRSLYEVATQSQAEVSKFIESQAAEFNKSLVGFLDQFAKNAPAGSDVAVAAMKSALAAANTAYDSVAKAAKQATELAETGFATAARQAKKTAA